MPYDTVGMFTNTHTNKCKTTKTFTKQAFRNTVR